MSQPLPGTPFIGRESEIASLTALLAGPNCRLLTIIGPGGKTIRKITEVSGAKIDIDDDGTIVGLY